MTQTQIMQKPRSNRSDLYNLDVLEDVRKYMRKYPDATAYAVGRDLHMIYKKAVRYRAYIVSKG